jgi:hypothetical protein
MSEDMGCTVARAFSLLQVPSTQLTVTLSLPRWLVGWFGRSSQCTVREQMVKISTSSIYQNLNEFPQFWETENSMPRLIWASHFIRDGLKNKKRPINGSFDRAKTKNH